MAAKRLMFVTGNAKKLEEVQMILGSIVDLSSVKVDLPELQGEPEDIAVEKCRLAAEKVSQAVIVEDTSLHFNALNGMPGPYIKWFLEKCGHDGLNNLLAAYEDKSAYAQCTFAYCAPHEKPQLFIGRCEGKIVPARGPNAFGWDPIFSCDAADGQTFAEMDKDFKNRISHRAKALEKLKAYLAAQK